jgi:glycosyltransferase involved in cell wall biosynthesis
MQSTPTVSIIIPAYNAAAFIGETIDSILNQTYSDFEIIVINDGSTDDMVQTLHQVFGMTEGGVKSFSDTRILYFYKQNEGVSIARNTGFGFSKGQYIVFFDADDVMSPDFLEKRLGALEDNKEVDFCCGMLDFFPIKKEQLGACDDIPSEILLYNQRIETCPSNYMFRRSVVERVTFHPQLASTADRFFLLQIAQFAKGIRIKEGKLRYRFNPNSMSGRLTPFYVKDNERFYQLLEDNKLIPKSLENAALLKGYYILGAMNWKIGRWLKAGKFFIKWSLVKIVY